jgi:hypothetical protein
MPRDGKQDVPLVVGLFLMVLAMMSIGNLGLSIANSRDIYKINAKINAIIDNDSHVMIAEVTKRKSTDESAISARERENTSLNLSPHPVYANVLMSKMVHPNSTRSEAVRRDRSSRWGLGVSKLANTGDAIGDLASNCKSWSGNDQVEDSRKLGCVYGAIATLITVGGADHATYATGAEIARVLKTYHSTEQERSEPGDPQIISTTLLDYQNFIVNITQSPMALMFDKNANPITYNSTGLPVMFGINTKGDGMLVTYQPNPSNISEATAIYGFVPPPPSALNPPKTLASYNQKKFVQGGIEVAYAFNQPSSDDGGWQSERNDYGRQMDHEVSCMFGDLAGNAYAWQIYDNNHGGTIAGGAIRAFRYATYGGKDLNEESRGEVGWLQRCQVA